jgi:hypothetical protein
LACKPNFRSILAISWASYWSPIRRFRVKIFPPYSGRAQP